MIRRAVLTALLLAAGCGEQAPPPVQLSKVAVALPTDEEFFAGPDAELLNSWCTACHGAAMVTNQPRLSAEQWQKTVTKMHTVYKAELHEEDIPRIAAALAALSAQQ